MSAASQPFRTAAADLPDVLPIFPLPGALLLPGQLLPLNIFEPRYLAMMMAALGSRRLVGMVQPHPGDEGGQRLYEVGCAGRISAFQETDDGRLLVELSGECRFRIGEELTLQDGYRRVRPDWHPFAADLGTPPELADHGGVDGLGDLQPLLQAYADANGLSVQWQGLDDLDFGHAVDLLCVTLPLDVEEKQALLEAPGREQRLDLLRTALMMGSRGSGSPVAPALH